MTYVDARAAILGHAPWGFWDLADAPGSTLADATGNARTMNVTGAPERPTGPGPVGATAPALRWPGSGDYAQTSVGHASSPFTITCWVYVVVADVPSSLTVPVVTHQASDGTASSDKNLTLRRGTSGDMTFRWHVNNGSSRVLDVAHAGDGWYHLAASVGPAGMKLRVNKGAGGASAINATVVSSYTSKAQWSKLHGAVPSQAVNSEIPIRMALPAVWTRQLSDAETDAQYDALMAPPPPPADPPTALTVTAASTASLELSWTPPATGPAPTGYRVRLDGGPTTDVALATTHTFTGLLPSTAYTLEVQSLAASGDSTWATLVATTADPPPPGGPGYTAHLRVGAHSWDVATDGSTPPDYGPLASLRHAWTARQDDGWPTQNDPTSLVFGVVVEAGTDLDDVDQGTGVHFTFTPDGYDTPLVTFGGTVRDLTARPHPLGMVYEITAIDHLVKLREDYHTAAFLASGSSSALLWPTVLQDADGAGMGTGTRPALPDPLAGDATPAGGFLGTDVSLDAPTWDVLVGIAAQYTYQASVLQRAILGYQLDGAGDLDAAHPFEGTWMAPASDAAPVAVPAGLLATQGTRWSRPRIEPNTVHATDPDLGVFVYTRPHTGPDVVRSMNMDPPYVSDFTNPDWVLAGTEGPDQWSTGLVLLADQDPALVDGWFTLPTAMATYVVCTGVDPRHTPNGSGMLSGSLAGAALHILPGGAWRVSFTLRRTVPQASA